MKKKVLTILTISIFVLAFHAYGDGDLIVNGITTVGDKIQAKDSGGIELATDEGTTRLSIADNGNVGIGIASPEAKLHVEGGDAIFGTEGAGPSDSEVFMYGGGTLDNGLCIRSGGLQVTGGSVGIGTTTIPTGYKLAVDGKVICEELEVEMSEGWSDFVFEENYKLQSLTEVEDYINENGHLPEIPSAEEVKENGLNLGKMQAKLLQKIEELTLYLIDMQKENENLKNRISSLETTK